VHRSEHEPILARDLFEAVQARGAANVVARQLRLRGSAAPLTGRLFDDRGNRMSPTHANKRGVRYRYYVSHALLQNRKTEAGSIARVPAPEIETLVCDGVRRHLAATNAAEPQTALGDRELIERHLARVIVKPQALEVCLIPTGEAQTEDPSVHDLAPCHPPTTITLPWTAPSFQAPAFLGSELRPAQRLSEGLAKGESR
jgi:site-specific DNA recombinase